MRVPRISDDATRDIEGIWVYIATKDFDAADRVYDEIHEEIRKLAEHPGMGHTRPEFRNPDYRCWKLYSYLIIYRYDDRELAVVRVIHGRGTSGRLLDRAAATLKRGCLNVLTPTGSNTR